MKDYPHFDKPKWTVLRVEVTEKAIAELAPMILDADKKARENGERPFAIEFVFGEMRVFGLHVLNGN